MHIGAVFQDRFGFVGGDVSVPFRRYAPTGELAEWTRVDQLTLGGFGDAWASIGCLYVSDDKAVSGEQLEQALIDAAKEEGLAFGLRVESIESAGLNGMGDPIYAYKVYIEDGREELVRGLSFLPVETRSLKHILAAGTERKVYNSTSGIPASVIAPSVLFEELELTKIEEEFDKRPFLESPARRTD